MLHRERGAQHAGAPCAELRCGCGGRCVHPWVACMHAGPMACRPQQASPTVHAVNRHRACAPPLRTSAGEKHCRMTSATYAETLLLRSSEWGAGLIRDSSCITLALAASEQRGDRATAGWSDAVVALAMLLLVPRLLVGTTTTTSPGKGWAGAGGLTPAPLQASVMTGNEARACRSRLQPRSTPWLLFHGERRTMSDDRWGLRLEVAWVQGCRWQLQEALRCGRCSSGGMGVCAGAGGASLCLSWGRPTTTRSERRHLSWCNQPKQGTAGHTKQDAGHRNWTSKMCAM